MYDLKPFTGLFSALGATHTALCITRAQLFTMGATDIKFTELFHCYSSSHALICLFYSLPLAHRISLAWVFTLSVWVLRWSLVPCAMQAVRWKDPASFYSDFYEIIKYFPIIQIQGSVGKSNAYITVIHKDWVHWTSGKKTGYYLFMRRIMK